MPSLPVFHVRLDPATRRALKILAAERGETMAQLIAAMVAAVKKKEMSLKGVPTHPDSSG